MSDVKSGKFLITIPDINRFFSHVNKTDSCWNWTGSTNQNGYGHIKIRDKFIATHILSYLLHKGPIPNKLLICHKCDVRNCVNPDHIWIGTQQQNIDDMINKGRQYLYKNCPKLTNKNILEIRKCVSLGVKQKDLALRFNVKESSISSIIKRQTWKHI